MQKLLIFALGVSACIATPLVTSNGNDMSKEQCDNIMQQSGLTARFPGVVAHAIHSMTLQDIRRYFDPNASSDLQIPSINTDVSSSSPILFNVVDVPRKNTFETVGMHVLDKVLLHMDNDKYMAKGYSPLENLAHGLHMHEVWQKISDAYKTLKRNPPTDHQVCPCVLDIESNGVLRMLRHTALKLREPQLMYGLYEKVSDGFSHYGGIEIYDFKFVADFDDKLLTKDQAFPRLDSSDHWQVWKNASEKHVMHDFDEAAVFLYCTLE